jgi:tetratricopeptide (TPR) repeat protein
MARPGVPELLTPHAADQYYNLLVQGFRTRQLSLNKEAPPGLAQLADPYQARLDFLDQALSQSILDTSYYKGRLYLYFGVTPVVALFWPLAALTGHYLFHRQAVAIFCGMGFLSSVGLLCAVWRRYFADVSVGVVAICALALGLATGVPVVLPRCDVYEVPISCGYMVTMLALGAIWCALQKPGHRGKWLTAASTALGLAVGARPALLPGAIVLLAPVIHARREHRRVWPLLIAAAGPILAIGLGLMLYNALRFDSPFEFGQRFQLTGPHTEHRFRVDYLWLNLWLYFFRPMGWTRHFPFVQDTVALPLPPGHGNPQGTFGILTDVPLVWLTLAVPLAWRRRLIEAGSVLRRFVAVVVVLFGVCALTFGFYYYSAYRFEMEFLPALVLLAIVGILGLERALGPTSGSRLTDRTAWRRAVRCGYGLLLGFSVTFNVCAGVDSYAISRHSMGTTLWRRGRSREAIRYFRQALRIKPDYAEGHCDLAFALQKEGRVREAVAHFQQALRIRPDRALAHYDLGGALAQEGRLPEAIEQWQQAVSLQPDFAEAHCNLGIALEQQGRQQQAIEHFQQALRIEPDNALARYNLGIVLETVGRVQEAIAQYEQALRIEPGFVQAKSKLTQLRALQ